MRWLVPTLQERGGASEERQDEHLRRWAQPGADGGATEVLL
jgi:hypothetical protein